MGSSSELETQIVIINKIKYIDENTLDDMLTKISDIRKMILGLIYSLKRKA